MSSDGARWTITNNRANLFVRRATQRARAILYAVGTLRGRLSNGALRRNEHNSASNTLTLAMWNMPSKWHTYKREMKKNRNNTRFWLIETRCHSTRTSKHTNSENHFAHICQSKHHQFSQLCSSANNFSFNFVEIFEVCDLNTVK